MHIPFKNYQTTVVLGQLALSVHRIHVCEVYYITSTELSFRALVYACGVLCFTFARPI
jgi:hypothetical protein